MEMEYCLTCMKLWKLLRMTMQWVIICTQATSEYNLYCYNGDTGATYYTFGLVFVTVWTLDMQLSRYECDANKRLGEYQRDIKIMMINNWFKKELSGET
jgi:hypothetical protein